MMAQRCPATVQPGDKRMTRHPLNLRLTNMVLHTEEYPTLRVAGGSGRSGWFGVSILMDRALGYMVSAYGIWGY